MSSIIQDVKITKHVNPSKQVQDEYTMMITFHDIVYVKKITKNDMTSNLFDFDMLENLIYNCNHKQKVGDIQCDMTLTESESFGKNLDMLLIFERNVKPMKRINEEHLFQLQEKKLDYDDKIGLAMTNLRNEINFTMIKPTTDIIQIKYTSINTKQLHINNSCKENIIKLHNCLHAHKYTSKDTTDPQELSSINQINGHSDTETKLSLDGEFTKFANFKADSNIHWDLLEYVKKYLKFHITGTYESAKVLRINIDSILKNKYVDSVHIQDTNNLIIFIDKTKKSNNRLIQYYTSFNEFIQVREQFKTYHILENHPHGILVEELP